VVDAGSINWRIKCYSRKEQC